MNHERNSWVHAGPHGWVNVVDTEFLNIEEGMMGDVMYFEYEGEEYSSNIVFGSKP